MRSPGEADAEAQILMTEPGQTLLAEVSAVARFAPADLMRWRKQHTAEWVSAAVRLVESRRKATSKFARADAMWFNSVGLEQATSELVAEHKARRFADASLVIDLCSGIGGDTIAIAEHAPVIAVDASHAMCRRLNWNVQANGRSDHVLSVCARAETFSFPSHARVHIDPDRRAAGDRRAREVREYVPGIDVLNRIKSQSWGGAIKLGPGSDFDEHFPGCEVEIISLGRECKEATVWYGGMATCRRRATSLPSGVTWTELDGQGRTQLGSLSAWIYDPDPALTRSGLFEGFAAAHALARPFLGIDVLTSDIEVQTPWLQAFAVQDVLSFDVKRVRSLLESQKVGRLEIKPRGIDLNPDVLRRELRLTGDQTATLFVIRSQGVTKAVLAKRPVNQRSI